MTLSLSLSSTSNPTHLDEPTMGNKKRFICWVHGHKSSFPVHIDPENTIRHLKRAVLAVEPGLSVTGSRQLELYVANIRDTDEEMARFGFAGLNMLRGSAEIQQHCPGRLQKKKDIIHFAIKRPGKKHSFILSTHIILTIFTNQDILRRISRGIVFPTSITPKIANGQNPRRSPRTGLGQTGSRSGSIFLVRLINIISIAYKLSKNRSL
jgi:hypothetical protein